MRDHKRIMLLFFVMLSIVAVTAMATLSGQDHNQSSRDEQQKIDKKEFESQFPIADSEDQLSTNQENRAKRRARSRKYDKSPLPIDPTSDVVSSSAHWAMDLPALPVAQSDAVVICEITNAQAYLSDDKTGVYSEFTIRVDEVLKSDSQAPLATGFSIDVERAGGRVRFPSGHIGQYYISGQGMPRVGRRYVLFLKRNNDGEDFSIITGYELRAGRVFLLDNPGEGHPITNYKGVDEALFLDDLRAAVTTFPQTTHSKGRN